MLAKVGRRVKSGGAGLGAGGNRTQSLILALVAILIVVGIGYALTSGILKAPRSADRDYEIRVSQGLGLVGSAHVHTDFAVFVDRLEPVNFGASQYQVRDSHVHVEGGVGDVTHLHATNVSIGFFLHTMGMRLTTDTLVIDQSRSYKNGGGKEVQMWVQHFDFSEGGSCSARPRSDSPLVNLLGNATWERITVDPDLYRPSSRDRLLITYIDTTDPQEYEKELWREMSQVTYEACRPSAQNFDGDTGPPGTA
ncbi:MAG: hypothetical protein HY556_11355 [Euryarchaeota archaeon]|nr:hypothetical protein [Euryarchaeota archaeon]